MIVDRIMIERKDIEATTHYEKRTGQLCGKPVFVVELKYKIASSMHSIVIKWE